jgi:hypothetical protein
MCLARIAGKCGMTTGSLPFVPMERAAWNRDSVVIRHELGHAVVCFVHGGGLGRLRCMRAADGLLEASVKTGPPTPNQEETPAFIDAVAERLLAGEVAARVHLSLPAGRISLRKLNVGRLPVGILPMEVAETMTENPIGLNGRMHEDVTKVLMLADQYHRRSWKTWIRQRLNAAETIIREFYPVIEATAHQLGPYIPIHPYTSPLFVPGAQLIGILSQNGTRPFTRPPVPI